MKNSIYPTTAKLLAILLLASGLLGGCNNADDKANIDAAPPAPASAVAPPKGADKPAPAGGNVSTTTETTGERGAAPVSP